MLRAEAVQQAIIEAIAPQELSSWLKERYSERVEVADTQFYYCLERRTKAASSYFKWLNAFFRNAFVRIVDDVGWDVWLDGTLKTLDILTNEEK